MRLDASKKTFSLTVLAKNQETQSPSNPAPVTV